MSGAALDPAKLPLRDAHLPAAPAWWPPAPGWWLVAAVLAALLVAMALWRRRARRRRIAAEALFDATVDAAQGDSARVAAISELLRRAARRRDPLADRLQGADWLHFLDEGPRARGAATFAEVGGVLLDGGFRRDVDAAAVAALRPVARARFVALMRRVPRRWRLPWSRRRG
jgi:Flp pilus assembly protein TadB